jgi:Pyridoxal-dependent decarboxylase, C-terminal sheet domain
VLAGPTCDSADILYEKTEYRLPLGLEVGDKVEILSTGAYTASYASVGFNGFSPIRTYCICARWPGGPPEEPPATSCTSLRSIAFAKLASLCAASTKAPGPPMTSSR